jgi:hypothetical protein
MLYVSGDSTHHRQYVDWLIAFFAHIVRRHGLVIGVVGTPKYTKTQIRGHGNQTVVIEDTPYVSEFDELDAPAVEIVDEIVVNQLLGEELHYFACCLSAYSCSSTQGLH